MAKIRNGFVSNSSSSSFVCDLCGYETSGWDMCLNEAEMFECENGHTLCDEHMLQPTQEWLNEYIYKIKESRQISDEEFSEWIEEQQIDINNITEENIRELDCRFGYGDAFRYDVPECLCPLCNFEELSMEDAKEYLKKTTSYTIDEVFEYVKSINKRRKKVRPNEYVEYVCNKLETNTTQLLTEIENRFNGSYKEFRKFLKS